MEALLVDRAVGRLDEAGRAALDEHLAVCPRCRERGAELADAVRRLDEVPSVDVSPEFDARLAAALKAERSRAHLGRTAAVAALAAVWHRLRRFELGAAVYPLVGLAMVCLGWAMLTRGPEAPVAGGRYEGPHGRLALVAPSPRGEERLERLAREAEEELDEVAVRVYEPALPEPELIAAEPRPFRVERGEEPALVVPEPVTREKIRDLLMQTDREPEPRAERLPAGGPRGSTLARARFVTIKNEKAYLRLAVSRGLLWLCRHQDREGYWRGGAGRSAYTRQEVTAAAVLAFMESGFTAQGTSRPSRHLRAALQWLLNQKTENGMFAASGPRRLHAQAMACAALSEALRLCDSEELREQYRPVVEEALAALMSRQSSTGVWGDEDAELTTLALVASGTARAAGLAVEARAHDLALAWLAEYREGMPEEVYASAEPGARARRGVGYAGIAQVLTAPKTTWSGERVLGRLERELAREAVRWESGEFFRWYVGTLAAYRLDGRFWQAWRRRLLVQLVPRQRRASRSRSERQLRGSWDAHGTCAKAGRAYATAMGVLTLTASCGHSPVYGSAK
jgi:hypothetical protein